MQPAGSEAQQPGSAAVCAGCLKEFLPRDLRFRRPSAAASRLSVSLIDMPSQTESDLYCVGCDVFIHDILHNEIGSMVGKQTQ